MRTLLIPAVAALLAGALAAQHEKDGDAAKKHPFIGDPAAIDAGKKMFLNGCAACHGAEGQGGRGPNLRERVFWHPVEDSTLFNAIQKGIPGGMPAANLPADDAWRIVAFVRSLTAPAVEGKPPGNAANGQVLFAGKGGCMQCHRVNAKGGALGPDLSNIGATRAMPQLHEAIVDPDADGAVGYHAVTVKLSSGQTLSGVARNRTNYSLQLQDAQGKLHLVDMAQVKEMTLGKGSPMPKDFAQRLSKQEIDDLVSFLSRQSLRPVEVATK